jgi:sec-independent protein translocase protein TatA
MPGWISPWELLILVFIALLFFGPKRLPEMGRGLGKGLRDFKTGIMGEHDDDKPELPAAAPREDDTV